MRLKSSNSKFASLFLSFPFCFNWFSLVLSYFANCTSSSSSKFHDCACFALATFCFCQCEHEKCWMWQVWVWCVIRVEQWKRNNWKMINSLATHKFASRCRRRPLEVRMLERDSSLRQSLLTSLTAAERDSTFTADRAFRPNEINCNQHSSSTNQLCFKLKLLLLCCALTFFSLSLCVWSFLCAFNGAASKLNYALESRNSEKVERTFLSFFAFLLLQTFYGCASNNKCSSLQSNR